VAASFSLIRTIRNSVSTKPNPTGAVDCRVSSKASDRSLLTRQGCEGRVGGQLGSGGGKQWGIIRLDLLRMRCPFGGDDRPVRLIGSGARIGVVHGHPGCLGWPLSACEDKEVM